MCVCVCVSFPLTFPTPSFCVCVFCMSAYLLPQLLHCVQPSRHIPTTDSFHTGFPVFFSTAQPASILHPHQSIGGRA